jgi:hypothetical protein
MTPTDAIPIVLHREEPKWVPWIRFLLGDRAGEVIEDYERTAVVPHSLVVADKLKLLTPEFLREVERDGTIGIYHIADQWYRGDIAVYSAFAYAWRNHYHTALDGKGVIQLPLPPAALEVVDERPRHEALRTPDQRKHLWSWSGQLKTTRFSMLKHMRRAGAGAVFNTGTFDVPPDQMAPSDYLGLLAESVFSPCPMGNVHMDSYRVYESLEMGAIPIVEKRPWLDYFGGLLGDHPLPTVSSWREAPGLVRAVMAEGSAAALQQTCVEWWSAHKLRLRKEVAEQLESARTGKRASVQTGRLRYRLEFVRHKNPVSLARRYQLVAHRIIKHGSVRHPWLR